MIKPHLDNEYKNRFIEFHMKDRSIFSSQKINWRQVDWMNVVSLVAKVHGKVHKVDNSHSSFKFFMNFRWGGEEPIYENYKVTGKKKIHIWTIGWTDGKFCYLKDIDFKTGFLIKEYMEPLHIFKSHIHPSFNKYVI